MVEYTEQDGDKVFSLKAASPADLEDMVTRLRRIGLMPPEPETKPPESDE